MAQVQPLTSPPPPPAPPRSPRLALLLEAPPGRVLWRLSTPNVAAVVLMTAVTVADAWFVGQLGTTALASLALVFPLQTLMQMMAGGAMGGGITSAVARALGAGDTDRAEAVAWHAVVIALVMAGLYTLVLGVFARPVFALFGASGPVLDGAVAYAHIAFGGAIVMWAMQTMFAILRGSGDTVTPARAVLVASPVQIALSGALTLGWGPFPNLGVSGPAVAMLIALGLSALYLGWHLVRAGDGGGHRAVRLAPRRLAWAPAHDILRVGALGVVNSLTIALTVVVVTRLVAEFGTAALAGYGLGSRLELMMVPLSFGIGGALTGAVGANVGARLYARARRLAWTGAAASFVLIGAIGLAAALWPTLWLGQFTADAAAFAMGGLYLGIAGPLYGLFGGGQTLYFACQGTGRMLLPVLVGLVRFAVAAGGGFAVIALDGSVAALFACVAAGLATVGIGLAACLFGPAWNPRQSGLGAG
ncbi:MAG: multidrug transporter [Alphaproteobacteria bacterium]|nr:multidrug transporter [Alphaproteobacteria bacterium]MCB9929022.1 multidrug transporter [Alphaproteobacteria bacterium]